MKPGRRDWLRKAAGAAAVTAGAAVGGTLLRRRSVSVGGPLHPPLLRPPGAGEDKDFLAACIRCGQCVFACPTDVLHLAGPASALSAGTPYLNSRENPCNLCEGLDQLECIQACPTDALAWGPEVAELDLYDRLPTIRMGVAVIDKETCLAWNEQICRSCLHACPFPDVAISLDEMNRAYIVEDACIGCGLCDYACLTEPSSIRIVPKGMEI